MDNNGRKKKEKFFVVFHFLDQKWTDPKLTWDPSDWDNVTSLHIKYDKVWLPDIVLYNVYHPNYT